MLSNLFYSICFLIFLFYRLTISAQYDIANIGAIIDVNSRIGKEEKISMEIAIKVFNNASNNKNKLVLHVSDSGGDPFQASTAADDLIKVKQVEAIIGMETWKEAALVTEIANKAQVPILSFAAPSVTPPLTSVRWPFLVRMAKNDSIQMECVASIVGSYGWRRVVAFYEDGGYNTDSGFLTLLSDALRTVGSEIEHWSAFPAFSTISDPKAFIREELETVVNSKQSRVFIILRSSLELATNIISEAKHIGLMGKDSVWITTDSVTNSLDTINSSVMYSMQGVIGIKTHFSKNDPSFMSFSTEFQNLFRSIYPEEDTAEPQIYAMRAYDTLSTIALALEKSSNNGSNTTSRTLLGNILSSSFNGLSGKIEFENGELSRSATYEIVNVIGKYYTELKFWSQNQGFSDNGIDEMSTQEREKGVGSGRSTQVLGVPVYWPGKLDRDPLGWVMPNHAKPMLIGVPVKTTFDKFVKVKDGEEPTGFCIDLFKKVLLLLNYDLPHKFVPFYGLYGDLVDQVYFKKFDAVVGDVTILANRSNYVEFTQPYAESGVNMVVPTKVENKAWLFTEPFNNTMWLAVIIVFLYTMFVVWFLEHGSNPEFRGPWTNQLSTSMWFAFSTLFFAHRETLRSGFTRVVVMVWLSVVFIVVSSYQASLTSMLTVRYLQPIVTDIETLRSSNSIVGFDGGSSVNNYLEQVLHIDPNNIIPIDSAKPIELSSGRIKAAFIELAYVRDLLSQYCKDYQVAGPTYRFGGLGFVFPKGSPIATDVSKAILELTEDGTLDQLQALWFKPSLQCSDHDSNDKNQTLSLSSFWKLFLLTGLTSTIMLVLYIVHGYASVDNSFSNGIKRLGTYFNNYGFHTTNRDPISAQARHVEELISSNMGILSEYKTQEHQHSQVDTVAEIEIPETYIRDSDTQKRILRLARSFPGFGRRFSGFTYEDPKWQHITNSTQV